MAYLKDFSADFDEAEAENKRETFENRYYAALSRSKKIVSQVRQSQFVAAPAEQGGYNPSSPGDVYDVNHICQPALPSVTARLPQLKLPEFLGSYNDWQGFLDTFNALVHDNKTLSNVEQFYYLQASLKDEPANIIASLPISESNYLTAWESHYKLSFT